MTVRVAPSALVVGADGILGSELLRRLPERGSFAVGTSHSRFHGGSGVPFDLADAPSDLLSAVPVRQLRSEGSWVAFLMAGITGFDRCAQDPVATRRINVTSTVRLAEELVAAGAFVVYPSSSAVFDESVESPNESSPTSPTSEYARQKADAEMALLGGIGPRPGIGGVAVVRLTKVVASTGLLGQWTEALRTGGAVEAASDLWLSPISIQFAVHGLIEIAAAGRSGLYHLAGENRLSYFQLAVRLASALGAQQHQVRPVNVGPGRLSAASSSTLDMSATAGQTGLTPQPLDSVIRDLVSCT